MSGWQLPRSVLVRLPLRLKRAVLFFEAHGRRPGRTTFTDKVNWRVVHDRRPLIGQLGDKLALKAYASATCPAERWIITSVRGADCSCRSHSLQPSSMASADRARAANSFRGRPLIGRSKRFRCCEWNYLTLCNELIDR